MTRLAFKTGPGLFETINDISSNEANGSKEEQKGCQSSSHYYKLVSIVPIVNRCYYSLGLRLARAQQRHTSIEARGSSIF